MQPQIVLNAVGLTARLLPMAPRFQKLAQETGLIRMKDVLPSVTCTAQATLLTGLSPQEHGIVGNGWLFRDTNEVRFWQQSNKLIQGEPLYVTLKKTYPNFRSAKLFWWFNQGATVDYSVTPKPHYGIDGGKVFGITGNPAGLSEAMEKDLGPFPFHTFWGPKAGLPCTEWIARCGAWTVQKHKPDLTLIYLPHLDYDPQRFGPSGCNLAQCVKELDDACAPIFDEAKKLGARILVVSEYGHCDVNQPILINQWLRKEGYLQVRNGPYGEQLDTFGSRAFAVCDHQLAHVYVNDLALIPKLTEQLQQLPGVEQVYSGEEREHIQLNHPRSGEIVLISRPKAWFAYPFWLEDKNAPDYARCVAIHHKPGYDPAELFLDPAIRFPIAKIGAKLIRKKLGFRMKMDVVPLDPNIVKGSHGRIADHPDDGPLLIGCGHSEEVLPMTSFKQKFLEGVS
ncbi:alkaline phosphatase family protein [Telmatocola sphagniphila]|uniref:Alkaline phosphatase family protein n=1 Tax=Telmatocola sphagniphila TaxID=1123043 RepID=A0A8E6B4I4_9BACT|nr:nucleotide pyrophosphatase/phosphodiesterase family protein [Telmatocola sphagniphila]QVL31813.1 alkaline phosphatase family protein [Telmatocola sphagniphila]